MNFKVWDTGGQERYRPVLATCYKNAFGVILVYDVTNKKSFANLSQWIDEVNEFTTGEVPKLLIGNLNIHLIHLQPHFFSLREEN